MGKVFKNLIISHTNDFPADQNDKIKGWIENNGGVFVKDLTPGVTHLLTTLKSWKRYSPMVKQARQQRIWILKLDWLEDSLLRTKPKRMEESKYSFEQMKIKKVKRSRNRAAARLELGLENDLQESKRSSVDDRLAAQARKIEKAAIAFDKACQKFEKDMFTAGFHPYTDRNGSVYMISLIREDVPKYSLEKHKLQLYESNEQPHTYACICQYSRFGKVETMTLELAPPGSTWDFAWDVFRKIFQKKCGKTWKEAIDEEDRRTDLDRDQDMLFECILPESFKCDQIRRKAMVMERSKQEQPRVEDVVAQSQADD